MVIKAAPSANRWHYIGFRARTSALHFSVFKIILFSRNHLHTSSSSLLRLYELHEQFFYPIREFFRLARAHSYFLRETSTWHVVSCPPGDTWYGMILSSVGVVSSRLGLKSECAVFLFNRAFSSCYAILKSCNDSETAVYGYNPTLFWVLSVSCWIVLQS